MMLDMNLLESILKRVADVEDGGTGPHSATAAMFCDLVPNGSDGNSGAAVTRITQHVKYLEDQGYITISKHQFADHWSGIRITSRGRKFLQPQLAKLDRDFLSKLVGFMDHYIEGSVQEYSAKAAWRLRLREALARDDVEGFANAVALIVTKFGASRQASGVR